MARVTPASVAWGPGRAGGSAPGARHLTTWIKQSLTLQELERLEQQHGASFNYIHISTAFSRAGHIISAGTQAARFHPLLRKLWARLQPQFNACDKQALANIVWACGKAAYADRPLLDACLDGLVSKREEAAPQHLSIVVYGAALLWNNGRYRIDKRHALQLVEALVQRRQAAKPQDLCNTLWAAATMRLPLSEMQACQLVEALVQQRQAAKPQELSNTLWAAATMRLPLATVDWQVLLQALAAKALTSQDFSNTLWAAAKRKADFAARRMTTQLTRVESALLQLADAAVSLRLVEGMTPQELSNSLWALSELDLNHEELADLLMTAALQQVAAMTPQHISNTALAAARLGIIEAPLFVGLVAAAQQQTQGSNPNAQDICNLCWAVAVADQQQLAQQVVALSKQAAGSRVWETGLSKAEPRQLWQVHMWLLDCQPGSGGLTHTLLAQQRQQCADAWEQTLQQTAQQRRTVIEQGVYACAQRLSCLAACCQEARTEDGAFSIDVTATHTASGQRLAIEADGPTHFPLPGRQLTGETLACNRALAARGYVVVSVPWWEWDADRGDQARQTAYLQRKVEAALQELGAGRPLGEGPAATA